MNGTRLQEAFRAHQAREFDTAARLYGEILRNEPRNFDALYLLGYLHLQRGAWVEAEHLIGQALQVNPHSVDALFQRGRALQLLGRDGEALSCFDKALALRPGIPEVLLLRGNALLALNRATDALASYDATLAAKPDFFEAWNNRGNALAALLRYEEALHSYERSLALRPADMGALHHRALTLLELRRYEDAAEAFARVLQRDPEFPYARGNRFYCKLNACDWTDFQREQNEIARRIGAGAPVITPIQLAAFSASPEEQLRVARFWAEDKFPAAARPFWRGNKYDHAKIRVAYLSADFHSHATAALMAGVFEAHDRSNFETVAISFGPDDSSEMRKRLVRAFDHFIDVREKSDSEIAQLVHHMEVDIAVDLKGYTQESRPGILAFRPAPMQVNYLGFPGSLGADYIDYILADATVIPPEHDRFYTEKIVRLPDCYQGNDSHRHVAEGTPSRTEAGLPRDGFVFCCFNNNFKILPQMFDVWMRILAAVEGSVLWLLEDNGAAARNLRREAERRGIAANRLVFARRVNLEAHLARHRLADLFLDTLPYNAHTTASDALWAGLPLVTCLGESFAGRVAASLLRAVGLPELIATSLEEYEALSVALARDQDRLAALKRKLESHRTTWPLFDTVRFTRNLEGAYRTMRDRVRRGLSPESFNVAGVEPAKLA